MGFKKMVQFNKIAPIEAWKVFSFLNCVCKVCYRAFSLLNTTIVNLSTCCLQVLQLKVSLFADIT